MKKSNITVNSRKFKWDYDIINQEYLTQSDSMEKDMVWENHRTVIHTL